MKSQRFIVASDSHGDMQDEASVAALWEFIDDWKPTIRVHAGDAWDFRNLRRGATDDEKAASLVDDWQAGSDFLSRFFDGGRDNHFLRGNHDERLWHFAGSATGLLRDYANDGIKRVEGLVRKSRAKMLPYDSKLGVLQLGSFRVVHGYHAGASACRLHASTYGDCLFGHIHAQDRFRIPSYDGAEGISLGCLCRTDLDYINTKTGKLKWKNSWAYGLIFSDGKTVVNLAERHNDGFICADNFTAY